MLAAVFLLAVVGLAVGLALLHQRSRQAAQQRTVALRAVAERLGWGYREAVEFDALPDLERFELFRSGRGRKIRNVLTSPAGDLRAVVFDYSYTVSSGNTHQTISQTVFYGAGGALALPSFSLRPENFFHRVGAVFGYQDIDLERRPEFSRMYLLRGEDEARVRELFTDGVAEFFERRPGSCATGLRRELLLWRAGKLAPPDAVDALIDDGYQLAERCATVRRQT